MKAKSSEDTTKRDLYALYEAEPLKTKKEPLLKEFLEYCLEDLKKNLSDTKTWLKDPYNRKFLQECEKCNINDLKELYSLMVEIQEDLPADKRSKESLKYAIVSFIEGKGTSLNSLTCDEIVEKIKRNRGTWTISPQEVGMLRSLNNDELRKVMDAMDELGLKKKVASSKSDEDTSSTKPDEAVQKIIKSIDKRDTPKGLFTPKEEKMYGSLRSAAQKKILLAYLLFPVEELPSKEEEIDKMISVIHKEELRRAAVC